MEDKEEFMNPPTEETTTVDAKATVEQIVQNGVSKDELKAMLEEIINDKSTSLGAEEIAKAEAEYFISHIKF